MGKVKRTLVWACESSRTSGSLYAVESHPYPLPKRHGLSHRHSETERWHSGSDNHGPQPIFRSSEVVECSSCKQLMS